MITRAQPIYAADVVDYDGRVVGFVNAISDEVATAFIPWLEVTRPYRGQGIGSELMRRMLARMSTMYSVDLCCDPDLVSFYERLGLARLAGMGLRHPAALR